MTKKFNAQFVRKGEDDWEPDAYFYDLKEAIDYVQEQLDTNLNLEYGQVFDASVGRVVTGIILVSKSHKKETSTD